MASSAGEFLPCYSFEQQTQLPHSVTNHASNGDIIVHLATYGQRGRIHCKVPCKYGHLEEKCQCCAIMVADQTLQSKEG